MVNITSFPDDVLTRIAYETLPDGIEAFSQCCKRFSVVSKEALMQHEAYEQKYREIQIGMDEGAGPLLIEVVRNPRCIPYIRDIDFEYCFDNIRVPLTEDITKDLTLALLQLPYVSPAWVPLWVQLAMLGGRDIVIATILLLVPRLKALFVPTAPLCETIVRHVAQQSRFRRPILPLSRLETVRIGFNQRNPAQPGRFFVDHGINIFQGLPSLRDLRCYFRTTRALDDPCIVMQLWNGATALHVFDLELSTEELEIILQHVRNLVEFTYIDRFLPTVMRNLDQTLRKYAGGSLEDLVLNCVPTPNLTMPSHGFTSLKGFTALERVSFSLDTVRTLWNWSSSRPRLAEFLPASVEDVTISGSTSTTLATLVLDELANAKEMHLPRIKKVHMSHTEKSPRTKVAGENAGIILELDESDEDDDDYEDDEKEEEEEKEEDDDNEEEGTDDDIVPMDETE